MSFQTVPGGLTESREFLELPSASRFLLLILFSSSARRYGGVFALSTQRLRYQTGLDQVEDGLRLLAAEGFIRWEEDAGVVWLQAATEKEIGDKLTRQQAEGVAKNLNLLPACALLDKAEARILKRLSPQAREAFVAVRPPAPRTRSRQACLGDLSVSPDIGFIIPSDDYREHGSLEDTSDPSPEGTQDPTPDTEDGRRLPEGGDSVSVSGRRERVFVCLRTWNAELRGTRHELSPEQCDDLGESLEIDEALCQRFSRIAKAFRENRKLREELNVGLRWAIKPENAERLLSGDFPPDPEVVKARLERARQPGRLAAAEAEKDERETRAREHPLYRALSRFMWRRDRLRLQRGGEVESSRLALAARNDLGLDGEDLMEAGLGAPVLAAKGWEDVPDLLEEVGNERKTKSGKPARSQQEATA